MKPADFTKAILSRVSTSLTTEDEDATLKEDLEALIATFTKAKATDPGAVTIVKINVDKQIVWGWALVSVEKGEPVCDLQGDVVDTEELQSAVHTTYMKGRVGKSMHSGGQVGEVVDSIVFTKDLQDALGIDLGREGWFVGMKITKASVWEQVKSGKLTAFSIGGTGERYPLGKKRGVRFKKSVMFNDLILKKTYAFTPAKGEPKLDISDAAHVAAAAAALGPGFRGQKVQLPSGAVAGVKAKVRAAYRRFFLDKNPKDYPDGIKKGVAMFEDVLTD